MKVIKDRRPLQRLPSTPLAGSGESAQSSTSSLWRVDDRYGWIMAFLMGLMVVRMVIPGFFDYENGVDAESGQLYNQVIWWGILGAGLATLVWRSAVCRAMVDLINPWFFLFFALAAATVLWSADPGATIRRLIRVVTVVAASWALVVVGWHPQRFQNTLRPVITVLLIGSLIFGVLYPDLAIEPPSRDNPEPSWHGLTAQKNQLGALASFGVILWFHGWLAGQVPIRRALVGGVAAFLCLVLSRSSTALIVTMFVLVLLYLLLRSPPNLRAYMPYFITLFLIIILIYAVAILRLVPGLEVLLTPLTMLTGKSATFSDRSIIWEIVGEQISIHPMLGGGYGAYWVGPYPTSASYVFLARMNFYPWSAHNGYMDVINEVGVIGLLLFLAFLVFYVQQSLRLLKIDRAQAALYLGLLFQQVLTNLSETHWMTPMNVDFIFVTIAVFAMARALLEERFKALYHSNSAPASPQKERRKVVDRSWKYR